MVSAAWEMVYPSCIEKSFIKAEIISNDYIPEQIVDLDEENSFLEISFFNESSFVDMENSDEKL